MRNDKPFRFAFSLLQLHSPMTRCLNKWSGHAARRFAGGSASPPWLLTRSASTALPLTQARGGGAFRAHELVVATPRPSKRLTFVKLTGGRGEGWARRSVSVSLHVPGREERGGRVRAPAAGWVSERVFSFKRSSKKVLQYPSHRILRYMYRALNVDEKKTNYTVNRGIVRRIF